MAGGHAILEFNTNLNSEFLEFLSFFVNMDFLLGFLYVIETLNFLGFGILIIVLIFVSCDASWFLVLG